jgi:hypothetical protein
VRLLWLQRGVCLLLSSLSSTSSFGLKTVVSKSRVVRAGKHSDPQLQTMAQMSFVRSVMISYGFIAVCLVHLHLAFSL